MPDGTLLVGDCLAVLPTLADASVQACITSPPYWQLRDYGFPEQHGQEPLHDCLGWAVGADPCDECFVCRMRKVFAQVWRVLRKDGTCWVNLGDTTASSGGLGVGGNAARLSRTYQQRGHMASNYRAAKLKPKNLLLIPARVALALQADGWIVRQDVVWWKKAPMPETAKDRPTRAHEYIFLLAKTRYYHYDAAAIAEPVSPNTHARMAQNLDQQQGSLRANGGSDPRPMKAGGRAKVPFPPPVGEDTREAQRAARKAYKVPAGWDTGEGGHRQGQGRYRVKNNPSSDAALGSGEQPTHRNVRSVWHIGAEPFKGAHFATFPRSLARRMILASTRPGDTVLDPYGGALTVPVECEALGRRWVAIEGGAHYADIGRERVHRTQPALPLGEA